MKERFFALIQEVKLTGAVETFYNTASAEELENSWKEFFSKNRELIIKITNWAEDFRRSGNGPIFSWKDPIEDPMEIALIIRIINDTNVSECEIFENWQFFYKAVKAIGNRFSEVVAEFINTTFICFATAEDFF